MANYITIDGGTTNTRISLVMDGTIADTIKLHIGAKCNTDGNHEYKKQIKNGISKLLADNKTDENSIDCILCSGMITSEYGLCRVPHTDVPCGIRELHNTMYKTNIEDISPLPFVFIRGVKADCSTPQSADMMRGEETELAGIAEDAESECLYVLPGSHSKLIYTDSQGRICNFHTEFTGELIEAVAKNTILKDIIVLDDSGFDTECLQSGYEFCSSKGINAAFFKVRTLKTLFGYSPLQCTSFFIGAALCSEINNIIKSDADKVVIGGKNELKLPMEYLIKNNSDKEVVCIDEKTSANAAAYGAIKIYEYKENVL
ncbi:MAG: 2-dehydro-3-deoxygalactonokinase [Clostridia bacterium]|nr:2-dehydro-3-deoxygalactonokinase [Clostridia bacterium]